MDPQRLHRLVGDADHVDVGQPDKQRAHAHSVALHRGSPNQLTYPHRFCEPLYRARQTSRQPPTPPSNPKHHQSSGWKGLLEGATFDYERFQDLCDVALTSPDSAIAHQSAVLLAVFWSHASTEDSKRMTNQYLNFAAQPDDDNLLAQVETLRQSIQAS